MAKKKKGAISKNDLSRVDPSPIEVQQNSPGWFTRFAQKIQPTYIFIVFILILSLTLLASYIASLDSSFEEVPTCGDGTFYNTCSLDKPYYCENGVLLERASFCGCNGLNMTKKDDACVSFLQTNPREISLKYFLNNQEGSIDFTIYEGVQEHVSRISRILYYEGSEVPSRSDFKIKSLDDDVQGFNLLRLVKEIQNLAPDSKVDQARIAVSMIQNIPYGFSEKNYSFGEQSVNYSRYPYEVLYDSEGVCGEKSALMAFLLKEIGYGTSIFYFANENHEAVGIKCPTEESLYGSGFCFVETGGPAIISDISMDFVGGAKLDSIPQVLLLSEGLALPEGISEYRDAKSLGDIRERNLMGYLKMWRYNRIREKYNIDGLYELK